MWEKIILIQLSSAYKSYYKTENQENGKGERKNDWERQK